MSDVPEENDRGQDPHKDGRELPENPASSPLDFAFQDPTIPVADIIDANEVYQRVRRLTRQQRHVLDNLLAGMDDAEACRQAGYATKSPIATIARKMPEVMNRLGLTDTFLIKNKLIPLLDATEVKAQLSDGQFVYSEPLAAHEVRLHALNMALKLKDAYPKKSDDAQIRDINVQIIHIGAKP
jgi:hypothetical protein